MKRLPKWIIFPTILIVFFLCVPTFVHAQPDPCTDPLNDYCPIDGGLTALIAVGVGYGIKKVKDSRKGQQIKAIN